MCVREREGMSEKIFPLENLKVYIHTTVQKFGVCKFFLMLLNEISYSLHLYIYITYFITVIVKQNFQQPLLQSLLSHNRSDILHA